jgi:hypothetical protein
MRVCVDVGQRKVPKGEADTPAHSLLDAFDLPEPLPRVRALVIAVLDDETTGRRTAEVIDHVVKRLQGRPTLLRHRVARHGTFSGCGLVDRIWLGWACQKPTNSHGGGAAG